MTDPEYNPFRTDLDDYWISCPQCTILVKIDKDKIIRYAPPLFKSYTNQPIESLVDWLKSSHLQRVFSVPPL